MIKLYAIGQTASAVVLVVLIIALERDIWLVVPETTAKTERLSAFTKKGEHQN